MFAVSETPFNEWNNQMHRRRRWSAPNSPMQLMVTSRSPPGSMAHARKCMTQFGNKVVRTSYMGNILRVVRELMQMNTHEILLVLDIDDTIFHTTCNDTPHMVEPEIRTLIEEVTATDGDRLLFLTARDEISEEWSQRQLQRSGAIPDSIARPYTILYAPPCERGGSTKGAVFTEIVIPYLRDRREMLPNAKPMWVCFIDDQYYNMLSMQETLSTAGFGLCNFTLFHYTHVEIVSSLLEHPMFPVNADSDDATPNTADTELDMETRLPFKYKIH